jgi:hypothetical protein
MSFEIGNVLKFDSEEYGEIRGLFMSNNGRQCSLHPICGKSVRVGDIVKFKSDRVTIGYQMHDAIQAVFCFSDGGDEVHRCKIGFLPSVYVDEKAKYVGKKARITALLSDCADWPLQKYSKDNCGEATWKFVSDEEELDGNPNVSMYSAESTVYPSSVESSF